MANQGKLCTLGLSNPTQGHLASQARGSLYLQAGAFHDPTWGTLAAQTWRMALPPFGSEDR